MFPLTSTKRFFVFDDIDSVDYSWPNQSVDYESYISNGLKSYRTFVPDDMDWDIYEACAISVKEQRLFSCDSKEVPVLTYGEIDFDCIAKVLYILKTKHNLQGGGNFFDLGSGTGKVVLSAALLHDFDNCIGIELLHGLHEVALKHKVQWIKNSTASSTRVNYINGSFLDNSICNWPVDSNVVFANTHCFDASMMLKLSTLAAAMKPGSFFICTTVCLDEAYSGAFEVIEKFPATMSWGVAEGFILRKSMLKQT